MLEPSEALLAPLRRSAVAAGFPGDGRVGTKIIFTQSPKPDTQRPYGLLMMIDEPRAEITGTQEATLGLSYWGSLREVEAFAEATEWIDGYRAETPNMKGGRYLRLSRTITEDPDLEGVHQLSDLLSCRYLSVLRQGASMP